MTSESHHTPWIPLNHIVYHAQIWVFEGLYMLVWHNGSQDQYVMKEYIRYTYVLTLHNNWVRSLSTVSRFYNFPLGSLKKSRIAVRVGIFTMPCVKWSPGPAVCSIIKMTFFTQSPNDFIPCQKGISQCCGSDTASWRTVIPAVYRWSLIKVWYLHGQPGLRRTEAAIFLLRPMSYAAVRVDQLESLQPAAHVNHRADMPSNLISLWRTRWRWSATHPIKIFKRASSDVDARRRSKLSLEPLAGSRPRRWIIPIIHQSPLPSLPSLSSQKCCLFYTQA